LASTSSLLRSTSWLTARLRKALAHDSSDRLLACLSSLSLAIFSSLATMAAALSRNTFLRLLAPTCSRAINTPQVMASSSRSWYTALALAIVSGVGPVNTSVKACLIGSADNCSMAIASGGGEEGGGGSAARGG